MGEPDAAGGWVARDPVTTGRVARDRDATDRVARHPVTTDRVALDRAFRALSDPSRRAILAIVREGHRAVGEIAETLGGSQQIVSHHLKVLREAGLVTSSRSGTRHLFAVRVEGLAVGKAFFNDFWPERLDALKRAVEGSPTGTDDD